MPGPPPKHSSVRRRRNLAPGAVELPGPAPREPGKRPTLPGSKDMLASTRAWWRTVWDSPMAVVWLDADLPALVRLAQLHDLTSRQFTIVREGPTPVLRDLNERVVAVTFESPVTAALLAEMRQIEDRLGLSPLSRRRLQWEVAHAQEALDAVAPKRDEVADARAARLARVAGGDG